MEEVVLDGNSLSIEQVCSVARHGAKVSVSPEARVKMQRSRDVIERGVAEGIAIYGVTTGIGEFARIRISTEQSAELQRRIIYSHSAGTGDPQAQDVVRAAMTLRANTLAKGYSGVRLCLIDTVLEMINKGVVPFVHEKGSVGTSGDLSPLSQFAEVAIGEGRAYYRGELMPGGEAMKRAGIKPTDLTYKEGLGLINGSQMMTAGASLLVYDAERVLKNAMIASAMTLDALRAVERAFHPLVHAARPHPGQNAVAGNLLRLFANSEIMANKSGKVQDGYSMRCTPQILGASLDALEYVRRVVNIETNAAADNPLFFGDEGEYFAAGNFHGQGVGLSVDFLCMALAESANLSERHTNRLLNPVLSGLPDFLVEGKGLNSGLMVAQYTAAALVSENKVLSHPASVDSISVSADQEDHVSMGPIAVRKCSEILRNVRTVLAIEMMSAAQAFEFHEGRKPGKGSSVAYDLIRTKVPKLVDDRVLHPDIEAIRRMVEDCSILDAVESEVGPLKLAREVDVPEPNVPA
ncbi:MAG: histidine ammonia-lyase [Phycisphaerales bacterium]|nr:MAG: histidine ammonia-lyase [Phycisphaerales bacterium]